MVKPQPLPDLHDTHYTHVDVHSDSAANFGLSPVWLVRLHRFMLSKDATNPG